MQEIRHHDNIKESYMKTHSQFVATHVGVIDCSILSHLTKLGWKDVFLLERRQLTSGATWYAVANFHNLQHRTNIAG